MSPVTLTESVFGHTKENEEIKKYTLSTSDGFQVSLIDFGATIQSIRQADRNGQIGEVTLGYDDLQSYIDDKNCFGCTIGRVTNRVKNARFELNGHVYELEKNDGTKKHHLHGIFNKRVWKSSTENNDTVIFKYSSPDGEGGYPGRVDVTVKYTVTVDHRLILDFRATSDAATPVNLTNHVYFNLSDDANGTILDHLMLVPADQYIPLDDELIPTGEIASVEKTPFDFRKLMRIGERINESFDGYDMMFVVNGEGKRSFGKLIDEKTGRAIATESTQKGLQFYTGNFLNGVQGRQGAIYNKHGGLCLETQNFSDSLNNQPQFPSIILQPEKEKCRRAQLSFLVRRPCQ